MRIARKSVWTRTACCVWLATVCPDRWSLVHIGVALKAPSFAAGWLLRGCGLNVRNDGRGPHPDRCCACDGGIGAPQPYRRGGFGCQRLTSSASSSAGSVAAEIRYWQRIRIRLSWSGAVWRLSTATRRRTKPFAQRVLITLGGRILWLIRWLIRRSLANSAQRAHHRFWLAAWRRRGHGRVA